MKKLYRLILALCVSAFVASAAMAADYQLIDTQRGVEVKVQHNPFGYNNQIVAFLKFFNTNRYRVSVHWEPVITCEGSESRKGEGSAFDMAEEGTYEVTIWRSQACGLKKLINLSVEMTVQEAGR
jgi:hypothetical protein